VGLAITPRVDLREDRLQRHTDASDRRAPHTRADPSAAHAQNICQPNTDQHRAQRLQSPWPRQQAITAARRAVGSRADLQVADGEDEVRLAEHATTRQRPALHPEEKGGDRVGVLMEPSRVERNLSSSSGSSSSPPQRNSRFRSSAPRAACSQQNALSRWRRRCAAKPIHTACSCSTPLMCFARRQPASKRPQ
jgi:hypothetical protein